MIVWIEWPTERIELPFEFRSLEKSAAHESI